MEIDVIFYDLPNGNSLRDDRGRVYIGSAKNIRERVMRHNRLMRYGKENQAINAAIASGFTFTASVVERLPPSTNTHQLREAERRYIDLAAQIPRLSGKKAEKAEPMHGSACFLPDSR